jgi:BirA family biotin operon repressor/biotin-[acetyl-CoA-carboxylase] ligase
VTFIKDIQNWRGYGRLVKYDKIGSTNEEGKILARANTPDWTILQSARQTNGKGRHGHQWISKTGNLFMSVVLRLPLKPQDVGKLSFLAGVAVARAVDLFLPDDIHVDLKWPNDALIEGQKLAGVLIETEAVDENGLVPWVVLGIGVNIEHAPDDMNAVCLQGFHTALITIEDVMTNLCKVLKEELDIFEKEGFAPIRKQWMEKAYGLGEEITVRLSDEEIQGIFKDLDDHGVLMLELEDGSIREITSGEIFI